jgi:hypothetical protein
MTARSVHQLMKMICAITKAKKRRTPITAIDPGVINLSSEFPPREFRRLELDGRIVFADTFLALILGGINLIINCYFFLLLFTTKHFAKKEPTFSLYSE